MGEYIIGITAAALLCAVAKSFQLQGAVGGVIKLVCAVVMTLSILSPLTKVHLSSIEGILSDAQSAGAAAAQEGSGAARNAVAEIITDEVGAYILDKAEALGVELTVEVELEKEGLPIPCGVTLRGNVSPYAKEILTEYIRDELGVGEEAQRWIS